jgi:hypothetical protein
VELEICAMLHMWQGEHNGLMPPVSACFVSVLTILFQKVKVKVKVS